MAIRRGFATTPSLQLHYVTDGDGPPLVLLHQSASSSDQFRTMIPLLARHRTVYAFDYPGHGASDRTPARPSVDELADIIVEAIAALGLGRVPIHGNHTGSAVSLSIAARHPETVSAISVVAIPFFETEEDLAPWRERTSGNAYVMELAEDGSHFTGIYQRLKASGYSTDAATQATIDRVRMRDAALWSSTAVFEYNLGALFPRVTVPLQVLIGGGDGVRPYTLRALPHLPHAEFAEHPTGSSADELADFYVDNLLAFLKRHGV